MKLLLTQLDKLVIGRPAKRCRTMKDGNVRQQLKQLLDELHQKCPAEVVEEEEPFAPPVTSLRSDNAASGSVITPPTDALKPTMVQTSKEITVVKQEKPASDSGALRGNAISQMNNAVLSFVRQLCQGHDVHESRLEKWAINIVRKEADYHSTLGRPWTDFVLSQLRKENISIFIQKKLAKKAR
jgi:hypothetical protein